MAANLAALMPEPSKAASISCRLASGVSTRPRLSCLRISPADNNDAVDVIASRLRHFHYLRQVVLRAKLTQNRVPVVDDAEDAVVFMEVDADIKRPAWLVCSLAHRLPFYTIDYMRFESSK